VNNNIVFSSKMSWGTELWVSAFFHAFSLKLCDEGDSLSLGDGRTHTLGENSFLSCKTEYLLCSWSRFDTRLLKVLYYNPRWSHIWVFYNYWHWNFFNIALLLEY